MKKSVVIEIIWCLGVIGMAGISWAREQEEQKTPELKTVTLLAAGSLTAEPSTHAVTFDAVYGSKFGVKVADSDSANSFVSSCVAQFPSKGSQTVKTFAGLPFVVKSLVADKDVELSEPIRITLVGGAKQMAWKNTKSARQPGRNHIDGEKGGVRLNGMWLLAGGTSIMDWGIVRENRGQNMTIPERYLNKPKLWGTLTKSQLILPSESSEVPVLCDKNGLPWKTLPTAIGVVWIFGKAGTDIPVGTECYRANEDGATIQFTAAGPIMKGVVKSTSQEPQTQSTASQPPAEGGLAEKPIVDVQIEKGGTVDFMALHWKWPEPRTWENLLKGRIEASLAALGTQKTLPSVEVTADFHWIVMVSLSPKWEMDRATSKDGNYQMQSAEVSLEGKLKAQSPKGGVVEIPFRACSVMFTPSDEFIPSLFDAAVLNMVSGLPSSHVDQSVLLNWVWERRQKLPQSVKHRHIEPNPQAKEGEPKEVVFEVTEPGPTIWDALLRIGTQPSLDRVLKAIVVADPDTQMAIGLAFQEASNRSDFRTLLDRNSDALVATFDKLAKEPKEILQKCLVEQKRK